MSYNIKKIKEEELEEFLLNPFNRSAYFGDIIIQKLEKNHQVDVFSYIDLSCNRFFRIGFILYEKSEIIVEKRYLLNTEIADKSQFVKIHDLEHKIREMTISKIEEAKRYRLDEIHKLSFYTEIKDELETQNFKSMIFAKLGTTHNLYKVENTTKRQVSRFMENLSDEKLISLALGSTTPIEVFVNNLMISGNFITTEIVYPELQEKVEKYVAAGKFTKREQLLIDYLAKTKASGAKRFTVETLSGQKASCRNEVNQEGKVISDDSLSFIVDIEKIKSVKYRNKIIYKKTTL